MAADAFWPHIARAIGALTGESEGKLTRVARPDGKCNYRDYGVYELTYTAPWSEHKITLELK